MTLLKCERCGKESEPTEGESIFFCNVKCGNGWADSLSRILLKFRGMEEEKE